MLKDVRYILDELNMISNGDRVVVGVSGGADSVALLLNLFKYRDVKDFEIIVAHINHLIRDDAAKDARFVEELCLKLGLEYHCFEIDVRKLAEDRHMSVEEAGRNARYEAMRSLNPDKIAVGHHEDDLTETVLLNMCRGSGLHGIAGISPIQGDIIRPLLYVSRSTIEKYLENKKQTFRTDSTNLSDEYTRNKIRLKVIPYLKNEINDNAAKHISNLSRDMCKIEILIDNLTNKAMQDICSFSNNKDEAHIDIEGLHNLDEILRLELLLKVMEAMTPGRKDISRIHIEEILNITYKEGEKRIALPYDLEAVSHYNSLIIRHRDDRELTIDEITIMPEEHQEGVCVDLPNGYVLRARIINRDYDETYPVVKYTKWIDYDKINEALVCRSRRNGDYLTVNDRLQKKSLKEYMINEKIPREDRDKLIVLADGAHIIWLPGYRISSQYKITTDTKRVLEVSVFKD